ncbi:MerR family transcriptional regulator [Streptomyces sp. 3MP-14]|uniref:MerR family transcriptional regulator n=1 Tax=Streptomyces mimosae TaxID=2586635 RepID=A0A5N6AS41_9ACTN|nr:MULTISPECIES: MerR family transcriptional regulator [Streptomyces]KAB8170923.1 MerR family transcriptional regulator [Streptomyces mimosae]KAB8179726.1 MerR family transcriptional regulator [Streptomyces sp. 3MP-14]
MRIGELAELAGVSARALRHYEDRGLLVPARDGNGYRRYASDDVARVARIRAMISAGLGTATIRRYLDCARDGERGVSLEMCPGLRAELDALARRIEVRQAELAETRRRLAALAGAPPGPGVSAAPVAR